MLAHLLNKVFTAIASAPGYHASSMVYTVTVQGTMATAGRLRGERRTAAVIW